MERPRASNTCTELIRSVALIMTCPFSSGFGAKTIHCCAFSWMASTVAQSQLCWPSPLQVLLGSESHSKVTLKGEGLFTTPCWTAYLRTSVWLVVHQAPPFASV